MTDPSIVKWDEKSVLIHLKQIAVEQLNMTPEQIAAIDPNARILDTLQLDSLAQVVLMTAIERDFGCTLDPEELQHIENLRDLLALIAQRATETARA
jgi:acyl carrier protein